MRACGCHVANVDVVNLGGVAAQSLRLVSDHAVVDGALDAVAQAAVSNSPDFRL